MNPFNALGFLVLGSLMNALPALAPTVVNGSQTFGETSNSALWLHVMGLVVGLIGSAWLVREGMAAYSVSRRLPVPATSRRVVPAAQPAVATEINASAQTA